MLKLIKFGTTKIDNLVLILRKVSDFDPNLLILVMFTNLSNYFNSNRSINAFSINSDSHTLAKLQKS